MSELISEQSKVCNAGKNCVCIKYQPIFILLILIIATLIGWCMLVLPSINISYDKKVLAIAGVSFLIIESITTLIILKLKRIKSKDDFSQMPKYVVTEYRNVNKNTLSKIFLIPNTTYSSLFLVLTFTLRNDLKSLFYWLFTLSVCYLVFNVFRVLKIEKLNV